MASIEFKKGNPLKLRATTAIHLGKVEKYINAGDIVEFDGQTLDLGGGEIHNIPQLRGAVLSGWLVPESDTTSVYTPQPADIKIRPALSADKERGEAMKVEQVEHEERVVGTVGTPAVPENRGARDREVSAEGVSVGRIQTPAVQTPVVKDSASAAREVSRLDSTTPPKVEATATGDVDQPIIGETLIDILPNAAAPGRMPATKPSGKSVKLANGDNWDMGRHWRTRARDALRKYSGDVAGLDAVRAVEVPSVHKFMDARINK